MQFPKLSKVFSGFTMVLPAYGWLLLTTFAYLFLYTAYDKKRKGINPSLLYQVLSFQSLDFTLKEFNKVGRRKLRNVECLPSRLERF